MSVCKRFHNTWKDVCVVAVRCLVGSQDPPKKSRSTTIFFYKKNQPLSHILARSRRDKGTLHVLSGLPDTSSADMIRLFRPLARLHVSTCAQEPRRCTELFFRRRISPCTWRCWCYRDAGCFDRRLLPCHREESLRLGVFLGSAEYLGSLWCR